MIGSILFFKKTDSLISKLIAKITKSQFTHVGLIINYDDKTNTATIIESQRFIKTRITNVQLGCEHVIYSAELTESMRENILKYAHKSIGEKYDYFLTFGIFLSLLFNSKRDYFNSANRLICSELIDIAYYNGGVKRKNDKNIGSITPNELLELYELKGVRKGV